jgi:D-glycero-D-manno-heptose 1,7-bisphosphate phosphatase
MKKKICAFLDRDGVINFDRGYIENFSKIRFRKGVIKGLKKISKKNYLIFIITNQAGIAKGHIKYKELKILNKKLINFFKKKEIKITKIKFCPHHEKGIIKKYSIKCKCRKPGNLMIKEVFNRWRVDKKKSFMIGDRLKDYQAAKKSKLYFEYAKPNFKDQIDKIINKIND